MSDKPTELVRMMVSDASARAFIKTVEHVVGQGRPGNACLVQHDRIEINPGIVSQVVISPIPLPGADDPCMRDNTPCHIQQILTREKLRQGRT